MLSGLVQMHGQGVRHGDLKSENVMLTSANWTLLTDVAAFKPVALPEDNPADFSYFFDSSGSRTCYIAPERFFRPGAGSPPTELTPQMDVFALGCVICELFLDGTRIFELSQLLDYRVGAYDPRGAVQRIADPSVRELVLHMVQLDPAARFSAERYISDWTPALFPAWFEHLRKFAATLIDKPPDERVEMVGKAFDELLAQVAQEDSASAAAAPLAGSSVVPPKVSTSPSPRSLPSSLSPGEGGVGVVSSSPTGFAVPAPSASPVRTAAERLAAEGLAADQRQQTLQARKRAPTYGSTATEDMLATSALQRDTAAFIQQSILPLERELAEGDRSLEAAPAPEGSTSALATELAADEKKKLEQARPAPIETVRAQSSVTMPVSPLLPEAVQQQRRELLLHSGPQPQIASRYPAADGLSLIVPFVTSAMRSCKLVPSKILALELLARFSRHVSDECRLQRIIPYVVSAFSDASPIVRSTAVCTLAQVAETIKEVPASDMQIFGEYLLPALHQLSSNDSEEIVLVAIASALAPLAESARRFLEASQLLKLRAASTLRSGLELPHLQDSYDKEMGALAKAFSGIVQDILTLHTTSSVKRAFMANAARVCVFFGQQRSNDLLLPLIITFLNDKDWRVREAFFHNIVGVASFVGRHSLETFILPCIQQALSDREEFVVDQAVSALSVLIELGLFSKHVMIDLCEKVAPMLLHPNVWIRFGVIGVVDAIAIALKPADTYCFVHALLRPFLQHDIAYVSKNVVLQAVLPPVSRASLNKAKAICATMLESGSARAADHNKASASMQFAMQLASSGIPETDKQKLVMMEPYISACSVGWDEDTSVLAAQSRDDMYAKLQFPVRNAPASLVHHKPAASSSEVPTFVGDTGGVPRVVLHEGWHERFSMSSGGSSQTAAASATTGSSSATSSLAGMEAATSWKFDLGTPVLTPWSGDALRHFRPKGTHIGHLCEHTAPVSCLAVSPDNLFFASGSHDGRVKIWDCQRLERNVTNRSRKTYAGSTGRVLSLAVCEGTHSVACGTDLGSLHVFRVDYSPASQLYSGLATVRTYDGLDGGVIGIKSWDSTSKFMLLYGLNSGTIGAFDLRAQGDAFKLVNESRYGLLETFVVGPNNNWIVAGTTRGFYVLWDVRFGLPVHFWRQPSKARIRRLVHFEGDLVAAAAGSDDVYVWDVSTATVAQLLRVAPLGVEMPQYSFAAHANPAPPMEFGSEELHDVQVWSSSVVAEANKAIQQQQGPPPASAAAAASSASSSTASSSPSSSSLSAAGSPSSSSLLAFSDELGPSNPPQQVQTSALFCARNYILTGGSDCCVRFWDCKSTSSGGAPASSASYTVCGPEQPPMAYSSKIVEGCFVQQATATKPAPVPQGLVHHTPSGLDSRALSAAARVHHDSILDIAAAESPHHMLLTAGRDGVIKVWK